MIDRQSQHVTRLIDDLLDIARIESSKLQLHKRTVDVRVIVADALERVVPKSHTASTS